MDERRLPAASSEEVSSADIEVERMCFGIVGLIEAALGYVDETVSKVRNTCQRDEISTPTE